MMIASVSKLAAVVNPLVNPPWKSVDGQKFSPITLEEVLNTKPKQHKSYDSYQPETRETHLERIHWMMKNGFGEDGEPIVLTAQPGFHLVHDGNHRLAAAILRNDDFITIQVDSLNHAQQFAY